MPGVINTILHLIDNYNEVILIALIIKTPTVFTKDAFEISILQAMQLTPGIQVEHAPSLSIIVETSQVASPLEVQVDVKVVRVPGNASYE